MPLLDVNDAFDPSFFDDITVIRKTETINDKGRAVLQETARTVRAVVTASSPDDLMRLPESDHMEKAVTVYTPFRLQGPSPGFAADEFLWHGSHYVVRVLDDFSGYGRGFVHAVAISMDAVDPPPIPSPVGSA